MQTTATVVEVNGKYATVETARVSACDGCHKATDGGCSVCSLMGSSRKISARAANPVGAAVGDRVRIESNTSRMLWYAVLVFLLPIVFGIGGWLLTALFTDRVGWQMCGGALAFALTFLGIFIYSKAVQKKACDIEITEILEKNEANE